MNVHYYALRMSHFAKHLAELVLVIPAELGAGPFFAERRPLRGNNQRKIPR